LKRSSSSRELQNKEIKKEMKVLHEKVDGIYGYRRTALNINRKLGQLFNHKRIYRLMKVAGIQFVIRKKRKYLHKYQTFEELSLAIDEYVHFYNYERYQKRLNGLSLMEYRAKAV